MVQTINHFSIKAGYHYLCCCDVFP